MNFLTNNRDRLSNAILIAAAFALPAAHADTISVPMFSMTYSSFGEGNTIDYPEGPDGINIVASGANSTTLSLGHVGQYMQMEGAWSIPSSVQSYTSMQFQAADGYRITGIEFSATVAGILTPAEVPADAVGASHTAGFNIASAYAGINGSSQALYSQNDVTNAVILGGFVENSAGFGAFDFSLQVGAMAQAAYANWWALEDGTPVEYFSIGTSALQYLNPTLTVYTEALPVPEPGTWAMLAAGLVFFALRRPRRS